MPLHASAVNNTESLLVVTGRSYVPDGNRRPVLWLHSAGGDHTEPWLPTNSTLPLLNAIAEGLGLPIAVPRMGGVTWGSDAAQTKISDALTYLRSTKGAHATAAPLVIGISMGGLASLNWLRANPTNWRALLLFYPATSLQAIHDGTGGAADGHVATEAAYGGLAAFNTAVAAHDPTQNAGSYTGKPILAYYSTNDTTVGTTNQTNFFAAVGGSALTTVGLGAATHADMTQVPVGSAQSFLGQYV